MSLQAQEKRDAAARKLGKWWRTHLHCREARLALEVHRQMEAAKAPARLREQEAAGRLICDFVMDAHRAYSFSKAVKLFVARVRLLVPLPVWLDVLPYAYCDLSKGCQAVCCQGGT